MGSSNATQALMYPGISHRAKLVLVRMALVAMDDDEPPRYFAGWELLALTLGYDFPSRRSRMSSDDRKRREVVRKYVQTVMRELKDARVVALTGTPAREGWQQEYHLYLNPSSPAPAKVRGLTNPPEGGLTNPSGGGSDKSERGVPETPPTTTDFNPLTSTPRTDINALSTSGKVIGDEGDKRFTYEQASDTVRAELGEKSYAAVSRVRIELGLPDDIGGTKEATIALAERYRRQAAA